MGERDTLEAFSLLWSVMDKIFEHVADMRNLLNTTNIPVAGSSSDDPPSYESGAFEHLVDQLKERIDCLEDLDKERKLLHDWYTNKRDACVLVENVHVENKQQIWDENSRYTLPDAATARDAAIRTLRSFLHSRQAALTADRLLLAQIKQGLSALSHDSFDSEDDGSLYWKAGEQKKFCAELELMAIFSSQLSEDQFSLLRDGRILEEKILSVPHDRGEETNKAIRRVQDSHRQATGIVVPTFFELLRPIFNCLPAYGDYYQPRSVLKSIVATLKSLNDRYVKAAESYQNALQYLADLIVP